MQRTKWLLRIFVAAQVTTMLAPAFAKSALDDEQHFVLPVRWCAVKGSPAVDISPGVSGLSTDTILRARHGRATAYVWMPQAHISFRSALTVNLPKHVTYPVIEDPRPPAQDGSGGAGQKGDILDPRFDSEKTGEFNAVLAQCEQAWEQLEDRYGINFQGIMLVNIRHFVQPDGTPTHLLGLGSSMHTFPSGTDPCTVPSNLDEYHHLSSNDGWVVLVDNLFTVENDPHDSVLAHELGHVLYLGHGNGNDDPRGSPPQTNARFDSFCDKDEDMASLPETLMKPKRPTPNLLTTLQRASARAAAKVTTGSMMLQGGDSTDGYILSDEEVDEVGEVNDPSVDLRSLGILYDTIAGTTTLSYRLAGRLSPKPAGYRFLVFSDEDLNPNTGGSPSTLGFPTKFQGAEYVSQVELETKGRDTPSRITTTVWQYRPGGFVRLPPDNRTKAEVHTLVAGNQGRGIHDVVSVQFPNDLVDEPVPEEVRFQAFIERLGGEADWLPNDADRSRIIRLTPPVYHVCKPDSHSVDRGNPFTLKMSGFDPNKKVQVLFDEIPIAEGTTNSSGTLSIQIRTPDETEVGLHLLVVIDRGTANTAHCVVSVKKTKIPTNVREKRASSE